MSGYLVEPDKKDLRWWDLDVVEAKSKDQAEALFTAFQRIAQSDEQRLEDYRRFTRIYENRDYLGMGAYTHSQRRLLRQPNTVINVTKQVVDTIVAKLAKTRPHVRFQTFSGNQPLQRKARLLESWVEAEQYRSGQEREGPDVMKDCCVFGTGAYKHCRDGKTVISERTHPMELFVDPVEAWDGKPSQLFQRKLVDREVLAQRYKGHAKEIRAAKAAFVLDGLGMAGNTADQLEVIEAWKTGPKGHRVVAINTNAGGLVVEGGSWKRDVPFTFIRWTRPRRGFWGIGLVEELMPLHLDINKTARQIQENLKWGNFQVWIDAASKIKQQKATNKPGQINTYRGQPPHSFAPDPVSQSLLLWLDQQYQRAFAQAGVSADSAAGTNTLGADVSGKSRRMFHDLETVRFAIVAREWEWLWLDSAKKYIEIGKEIAKRNPGYTVVGASDRYTVAQLKWSEVDMDRDAYVIRCAPISALSVEPSSRRAEVGELIQMGIITEPGEAKRMLEMPDLDAYMALDRASRENIDRIIDTMLEKGVGESPEPFQDHQLALKVAQAKYNKAIIDGVPEDRLTLLRQYMTATNKFLQTASAVQQGAATPGAPGAPPAPGPTGQSPTAVTPQDGTGAF